MAEPCRFQGSLKRATHITGQNTDDNAKVRTREKRVELSIILFLIQTIKQTQHGAEVDRVDSSRDSRQNTKAKYRGFDGCQLLNTVPLLNAFYLLFSVIKSTAERMAELEELGYLKTVLEYMRG
jgi:hypothetical protein